MADNLNGKIAIITGGARDIGRSIAMKLGAMGAGVVVNYNDSDQEAEKTLQELEAIGAKAVALPYLNNGGAIINISSLAARSGGGPGAVPYATAKGGVLTFTRALAKELASKRIRVNCVEPGVIATRFHDVFTKPEVRKSFPDTIPLGREGEADEVAAAVAFLASDASTYITGEALQINGGIYFV